MTIDRTALVVRTTANRLTANTFCAFEAVDAAMAERLDAVAWDEATEDRRTKALISAYRDLDRLPWADWLRLDRGDGQTRVYDFPGWLREPEPPVGDGVFDARAVRAQGAQALWLLQGEQVRTLQRDGIRMTRQMRGSELEIAGYRGPVCVEAMEILGGYFDWSPSIRVFAGC